MKSSRPARAFTVVLCAVDFSTHAKHALRHGVAIARRFGGKVTVVYVNDPLLTAAAAAAYNGRELARTSIAELKRFVEQAVGDAGGVRIAQRVVIGEPAREIRREARRIGADLVVLGTQGLSGGSKLFFGSTTERVLRQATVPVLAIPPSEGRVRERWPGRRALAAIDLDADASADLRSAEHVARAFNLELVLAHIVEPDRMPPWLAAFGRSRGQTAAASARAELASLATRLEPDLRGDTRVLVGNPSDQIGALAKEVDAGLIIVSLRRGDGLFGAAQGTVTYRILSSGCPIPILALPSRGRASRTRGARAGGVHLDPSAFT
jgi:nucleotide-binding universal stress UspA family protein